MAAKLSTKHPYAAVDHRVMDSEAYIDLTYSAQALLLQLARQLNGHNNGRLQATFSYLGQRGFSENTISRGIAELIAHGMIYRARAGGYQQGPAKYAVTWLSICKITDGLFLRGFKIGAWRDWDEKNKKIPPPKLMAANLKNGGWTAPTPPKIAVVSPPKIGDIECVPCRAVKSVVEGVRSGLRRPPMTSPFTIRLSVTTGRRRAAISSGARGHGASGKASDSAAGLGGVAC